MPHHIFLSYSRKDLAMMQRVRDDLRAAGLRVWTDEGIEPGSISWKEAIEQAIRETHMVVTLLSPAANDSMWVQREIDYAEVRQKPIIPVLIAGHLRDAIPFALAGSQLIDLRKYYQQGIAALQKRCIEQLDIHDATTLVHRAEVTVPAPIRRKEQSNRRLATSSQVMLFITLIFLIIFNLSRTTNSAEGDNQAHLLLLYNNETLVLKNNSDGIFLIQDIVFELVTDSKKLTFNADTWGQSSLRVGRCVQIWRVERSYLSPDEAPADSCFSRVAYRASSQLFWLGNNPADMFVVRNADGTLETCPVSSTDDERTLVCRINL